MIKLCLFFISFLILISCGDEAPLDTVFIPDKPQVKNDVRVKDVNLKNLTFSNIKGEAVLIGDTINLLYKSLNKKSVLNEGEIVKLKRFSNRKFKPTNDYCEDFHYLEVSSKAGDGIIDGRNVYSYSSAEQDTFFRFKNKEFQLKPTIYYGVGPHDEDGLTFCNKYYEPVVLTSGKTTQLIRIIQNDYAKEASRKDDFKFFELMANDGAFDKITKIDSSDTGVILTIFREFQEGYNHFQVQLILTDNQPQAKYLNYEPIKYEEEIEDQQ